MSEFPRAAEANTYSIVPRSYTRPNGASCIWRML